MIGRIIGGAGDHHLESSELDINVKLTKKYKVVLRLLAKIL